MSSPSSSSDATVDCPGTVLGHISKKKKKCNGKNTTVRFSKYSEMVCFKPSNDTDTSACWYSRNDEQRFKLQAKHDMISHLQKTDDMSLSTSTPSDDVMTPRSYPVGLEQQLVSSEFTKKRIVTKRLVQLAVRMEQARTNLDDDVDVIDTLKQDRIAMASMQYSEWSRHQATAIGTFHVTMCLRCWLKDARVDK